MLRLNPFLLMSNLDRADDGHDKGQVQRGFVLTQRGIGQ
jgi:hypothetical protein